VCKSSYSLRSLQIDESKENDVVEKRKVVESATNGVFYSERMQNLSKGLYNL
jgi:hypothetical protein